MFARSLRSLTHSQSLSRSRRSRAALIFCIIFSFNAIAEEKNGLKNVDKIIIDGVLTGITAPFKNLDKTLNYTAKSADKKFFGNDGKAEIETKDGNLKINTANIDSMKLAAEFRRNYKKSSECLEPINEEINIKCANKYIRARKAALNPTKNFTENK